MNCAINKMVGKRPRRYYNISIGCRDGSKSIKLTALQCLDLLLGTFKAGRISHLASRISHLMRFVMIKFKSRSGSHEAGN